MITLKHSHSWNVSTTEAKQIQEDLRTKISLSDDFGEVNYVGGVDGGFEDEGRTYRAAVVILKFPELTVHEHTIAKVPTAFPYVPGYLSFREVPGVLKALDQIKQLPQILLCDGQGYAHPRRMGIACHLGILTDIPTIGVAKSWLIGKYDELPEAKGSWAPLIDKEETIGAVVRTRAKVKPLYISPGHRISLESAIDYVLRCTTKYKQPETTRWAHHLASDLPGTP